MIPKVYEIRISVAQRDMLVKAIMSSLDGGQAPWHGDEWDEVAALRDMLEAAEATVTFDHPVMNDFTL